MFTKLNKSRQRHWFSLFLVLFFVGSFMLPPVSPSAMAATGEILNSGELSLDISNNQTEPDLLLEVAAEQTEQQTSEISDSNLSPVDNGAVVPALETLLDTEDSLPPSDLAVNDLKLLQEFNAAEEPMHSSLAVEEFAAGTGTEQDPYLVATEAQLNNVRNNLDKHFKQTANITLKVATWNAGKGWEPIGAAGTEFTGSYDGNGLAINKLYINRPDENNIGFFGILGDGAKLSNIALEGAIVTGKGKVGGLAGRTVADEENATEPAKVEISNCRISGNVSGQDCVAGLIAFKPATAGEISNCSSTATISGKKWTGGLVGENRGPIKNSFTTGKVVGTDNVGGLVGQNESGSASITDSQASGEVNGSTYNTYVGGLVGYNNAGIIENSHADGAVTVTSDYCSAGGLVGYNINGLITRTYATGAVTGCYGSMGGLIGYNESGQICESYATGNVTRISTNYSYSYGGGLIGTNYGTALVSECYASGNVNLTKKDDNYAGGLIGRNYNNTGISIRDCYAIGKVTVSQSYSAAGGLIGTRSYDTSIISGAYYDKTTTGQSDTTKGGIPKTTAEMMQQATFEGWDFNNTWTINEGSSYPEPVYA